MKRAFQTIIFIAVGLLCVNARSIYADVPDVDSDLQYISDNTMSPYCPGLTLSSCPSPQATELRGEIRALLVAGYSVEAVQNQLKMRFGSTVAGVPLGSLIWIIPGIFVLLGGLFIVLFLRRTSTNDFDQTPSLAIDARVEEELRRRLLGD